MGTVQVSPIAMTLNRITLSPTDLHKSVSEGVTQLDPPWKCMCLVNKDESI